MSNSHLRQAASMAQVREPKNFGKRREATSITICRNGRARQFSVSPLGAAFGFALLCMFAVGYFGSTAYLMLRDDLIGMTQARSARLLHEYEDRIAMLRANLDRVTSRQLLDQQAIEARVAELMQRQDMLGGRNSRIGKLLDEAQKRGLATSKEPARIADPVTTGTASQPKDSLTSLGLRGSSDPVLASGGFALAALSPMPEAPDITDYAQTQTMFTSVKDQIEAVDRSQREMLDHLRRQALERTGGINSALARLKIKLPAAGADSATGGPFIALAPGIAFDAHVDALDISLKALDAAKSILDRVPVGNPAPGSGLSSPFGVRADPFLGHTAMHSGLDFRAETGTPVRAAADGKVVDAGRNGGYGNMVEIDHGNGITTRYAHLSRITVKSGDRIRRGAKVGEVGSTGRSTGPHLHYEIRRHGDALNPMGFIKTGREISRLL